jgi:leader peptidase (prepilin peptidase)/N-methyltransferase
MLVVTVIDLEHFVIPNRVVYPTLALALPLLAVAAAAEHRWDRLGHALVGGGGAWLLLLLVHLVSPRGMGFGDVRLAFVLGLFLGWLGYSHVVLGLFAGFLLGSVAGIVLVVGRRRSRKDAIPFGPFLAAGALLAVLAGTPVLHWYRGG